MTLAVWKFPLQPGSPSVVRMPRGATVIHVGHDGDTAPVLWAIASNAPIVDREFWVYGTGHDLPSGSTGVSPESPPPTMTVTPKTIAATTRATTMKSRS